MSLTDLQFARKRIKELEAEVEALKADREEALRMALSGALDAAEQSCEQLPGPSFRARVFQEVQAELNRAESKFGPMASPHEGYAVILEELDELWTEVKHGSPEAMRAEAIQVCAMAARFLRDCCSGEPS